MGQHIPLCSPEIEFMRGLCGSSKTTIVTENLIGPGNVELAAKGC